MEIYRVENGADGGTAGLFFDRQSAENARDHLNKVSATTSAHSFDSGHWRVIPEAVTSGENLQWQELWCVYVTRGVEFTDERRPRMLFTGQFTVEEKLLEALSLDHFQDSVLEPRFQDGQLSSGGAAALYGSDLAALRARGRELADRWSLLFKEQETPVK